MKQKSFTLVEVLVVIVVIGILATLGFPSYRNFVEESKAKVCATNLEILKASLDIYAMENDEMPGSLTQLPSDYIKRAYASVFNRKDTLQLKIAYWVVGFQQRGLAYAGLLHDLADGNLRVIVCPADHTPPPSGVSYALNSSLSGMKSDTYRQLEGTMTLIVDWDSPSNFSGDLSSCPQRHSRYSLSFPAWGNDPYVQHINKSGAVETYDFEMSLENTSGQSHIID